MIDSFKGEYAWLSNFHPVRIEYEGIGYKSVEAAYQAQKTHSLTARYEISKMSAYDAKKAGRAIERGRYFRNDWMAARLHIMNDLLTLKFKDARLAKLLLDTGTQELIEGNTWGDRYWGVCNGIGQNMLGKLLMLRRKKLIIASMPPILEEDLFIAKL